MLFQNRFSSTSLPLVACLLVTLAIGCGEQKKQSASTATSGIRRFIFITNGDDPFWDACNAGLIEGATQQNLEAKGLRVVMEKNNGTAQGQIEKLRQFVSQSDIAGVAISVIQAENEAIAEAMKTLATKGVHVITVDSDVNREKFRDARRWYIGTDNITGGRLLGTAAAKILQSRGKKTGGYVQFAGFTDNDNARARMNGFKDSIGEGYHQIDRMSDEMDLSKARDNVRTALVNHPDLTALVGIWAYNAPAIAEVVRDRKVRDRTTIVTFDAQAAAIEQMKDGGIDAMVVQNPFEMGKQTVRLLAAMQTGDTKTVQEMFPDASKSDKPDGDIYTTGLRLIVPDPTADTDDSPLKAEDFTAIFGDTIELLPLSEFRQWLATYGLSSS